MIGAIIGAVAGIAGSAMSSKASKDAAEDAAKANEEQQKKIAEAKTRQFGVMQERLNTVAGWQKSDRVKESDHEIARVRVAVAEGGASPVMMKRLAGAIGFKEGEDLRRIEVSRTWQWKDLEQAKKDVEESTWDAISAGWLTASAQSKQAMSNFLGNALQIGAGLYDKFSQQSDATNTTTTSSSGTYAGTSAATSGTAAGVTVGGGNSMWSH